MSQKFRILVLDTFMRLSQPPETATRIVAQNSMHRTPSVCCPITVSKSNPKFVLVRIFPRSSTSSAFQIADLNHLVKTTTDNLGCINKCAAKDRFCVVIGAHVHGATRVRHIENLHKSVPSWDGDQSPGDIGRKLEWMIKSRSWSVIRQKPNKPALWKCHKPFSWKQEIHLPRQRNGHSFPISFC